MQWEIGKDAGPQVIHITMHDDKPVRILGVTTSSPSFRHVLKTIEEGRKYDLEITPESPLQVGLGLFRIETDSPYGPVPGGPVLRHGQACHPCGAAPPPTLPVPPGHETVDATDGSHGRVHCRRGGHLPDLRAARPQGAV